jgi:hypothetical protein
MLCGMKFPERIYTKREVEKARMLIRKGYQHCLTVEGSVNFRQKVKKALDLIEITGYADFLRKYIRSVVEIDGLSQLRQEKATIWANKYAINNIIEAAGFLIQKAFQMKEYLEGKVYYGGEAERRAVQKRVEFLKKLLKSGAPITKKKCKESLKRWTETIYF